jgi:hypothetical protein
MLRRYMPRLRGSNIQSASDKKCSLGVSVLMITGLSALSWAVVIWVCVELRALV